MDDFTQTAPAAHPRCVLGSSANPEQALRILELLGKDPAHTHFRFFVHKENPRKWDERRNPNGIGARTYKGFDPQRFARFQAEERNAYFVPNHGGTTKEQIISCPALFCEWDNKSIDWQLIAWKEFGLPEPTFIVLSGNKSAHLYWVLTEPVAPEQWLSAMQRLAAHCGSDKDVVRVTQPMRLPGFAYIGPEGTPTGETRLTHVTGTRYTLAEVMANVPELPERTPAKPRGDNRTINHTLDEIKEALSCIPAVLPNTGQREHFRAFAWGLRDAVRNADGDDDVALELLEAHSPEVVDTADYFCTESHSITAATFWKIAGDHGHRQKLTFSNREKSPKQQVKSYEQKNRRKLSHTRLMACFERCVEIQAKRERNSLRRRARLLKAAKDLGLNLFIKADEISQRVLEAKAQQNGEGFSPLTAADRAAMKKPKVRWLLHGLLPAGDLTIIGGRPKVGKTRLAMAMVAAVLNGEGMFDLPSPLQECPVVLVTDDQSDADTNAMLEALKVWDHPRLITSSSFRLSESDLDGLLELVKAHPGALVVLDSLRSISRVLSHGENDPEIGTTLYDLKQAVIDAGGTLLLIHHCNKTESLVGVEALSGHSAIAGAANTILTLHYIVNGKGQPDKSGSERRLVREARTGGGFDDVVTFNGPRFRKVGTHAWWQQQLQEAQKKRNQQDKLTPTQRQVLELIEESSQRTFTRRQLVEAMGLDWGGGQSADATRVRDALDKLVSFELIHREITSGKGGERVYGALA
jgi:hypothetical protein